MTRPKRLVGGLALAAMLLSGAVACGDGGDDGGSAPAAANKATGEPIRIGFINQEQAASGSFPDLRTGASAAAEYVNNQQGGVDGRPVEFVNCTVDGSPEASQRCANQMVEAKVPLVISGLDFSGPSATAIIRAAGIPYVPILPIQGTDLTGDGVFAFLGGSPGQFAGVASYVTDEIKAGKVTILANDTPPGVAAAESLQKLLTAKKVGDVQIVKESPTATDFTASVTAANDGSPDAIVVMFVSPSCSLIMQSAQSLGIRTQMIYPSSCLDPANLEAAGAAADGALITTEQLSPQTDPDDPDVSTLVTAMKDYADVAKDEITSSHTNGFGVAMTVFGVLGRAGKDITAASVLDALKASKDQDGFLDDSYSCDGTALTGVSTVCNGSVRIVRIEGGKPVPASDWTTS
ncbi:branched-chain amino acid transport system substrate-binding protein [Parafrankia irregularis]|uniref:Branched-chain amino acid transport system substrate-binding protein n=1 Tax=Parafrankia irregularis TaxID=795642 RepID=A0A0S4QNU2_9ACTN|nr:MULTISPECIES: ABC transporter substrate-binding protein [Parafrankia]MBE3200046.1 ABC transporter substrate-binding protein [Parafrankia sp. CH37]CUU56767.1 branched-chain amino acid transport system substrate-binding protein [Parafrankia irregularis]